MATVLDFATGSGRGTENEVDLVDVVALMLVPITGAMLFEVWSMQINVFGGYDFTGAIWTVGGAPISAALLITVFADLWIIATNILNSETSHEPEVLAAIAIAILAPIAYVFVPAFAALVNWHDLMKLAFTLYLAGASVIRLVHRLTEVRKMEFAFFNGEDAEAYKYAILGYCLGASGLTVVLAAIAAAGVV